MNKYKKNTGWFNYGSARESERHSLASKGIKTGRKSTLVSRMPINYNKKETSKFVNEYSDLIDDESLQQFLKELDFKIDDIKNIREEESGILTIEVAGQDWLIFDSEDKAEEYAKDRVRQDLEDNPEYFTQSWLECYIDTDHLRDELESDVSDMNHEYFNDMKHEDIIKEADMEDEWDELDSEETELLLKKENTSEEEARLKEIDILRETMVGDAVEKATEKKTEEDLEDPIEYLEGIYGKADAMKEAIKIGGINIDDATDDAISVDGWQHFVSTYDGDSIDLPNGKVIARLN
jgi:hypothetical protein